MQDIPTRAHPSQSRPHAVRRLVSPQARTFALLALLIPLFGALQALALDGAPRVEVRVTPRDVPVETVVDRIVERLVFVPVPTVMLRPWPRLTWDLSRWDMSRLPHIDTLRIPAFRPGASVQAEAPAADAPTVIGAGLPTPRLATVLRFLRGA